MSWSWAWVLLINRDLTLLVRNLCLQITLLRSVTPFIIFVFCILSLLRIGHGLLPLVKLQLLLLLVMLVERWQFELLNLHSNAFLFLGTLQVDDAIVNLKQLLIPSVQVDLLDEDLVLPLLNLIVLLGCQLNWLLSWIGQLLTLCLLLQNFQIMF